MFSHVFTLVLAFGKVKVTAAVLAAVQHKEPVTGPIQAVQGEVVALREVLEAETMTNRAAEVDGAQLAALLEVAVALGATLYH
jgi:hypothetical protein